MNGFFKVPPEGFQVALNVGLLAGLACYAPQVIDAIYHLWFQ